MTLPGKIILSYLGVGALVAVARQVSGATPGQAGLAASIAVDVIAWPYSVYQWASSASSADASTTEMKRLPIGAPLPTKTLQKSASGSSTPGYF